MDNNSSILHILIYMQNNNQEWQGFEEFNDQLKHLSLPICKPKTTFHAQSEPSDHKPNLNIHTQKSSFNKKIISFKTTKKRKFSLAQQDSPKKRFQKKSVIIPRAEIKNIPMPLERQLKNSPNRFKEDKIPIFRFPHFGQLGKLIYKSILPMNASEYLSYADSPSEYKNSQGMSMDQKQVVFNSQFEGGNLDLVRKINNEYHMYLSPDTNTQGHRQWFYFTVSSMKQRKIRVMIHGFKKAFSLFQKGMNPYGKKIEEDDSAWKPIGNNVKYIKEQGKIQKKKNGGKKSQLFCLVFFLPLEANTTYCIASCIPYTYSQLNYQIDTYEQKYDQKNARFEQETLCKTLMGFITPLLTFCPAKQSRKQLKKYIIINARTHPGESSSSWVAEGILDYLVSSVEAQEIIKQNNIYFKIVPMLNPDGVYMGNYRTGILGIDYNRLFLTGKPDLFPQIQALKNLVRQCKSKGKVDLYLDLHSHSIHPGCFIYGPDPCFCPSSDLKELKSKLKTSPLFAKKHCIYGANNSKLETSRVYFQIQEGVYSLTCENSLGLRYKDNIGCTQQFTIEGWKQFGMHIIKSILSIYEKKSKERDDVPFQKFMHSQTLKNQNFQIPDLSNTKKYKTDSQNFIEQFKKLQQVESEDIDLLKPIHISPVIQEEQKQELNQSLNDSDNESDDLNAKKKEELFKIVTKIVEKRNEGSREKQEENDKKWWFKDRPSKHQNKQYEVGNIKEYRFGIEDNTLTDWINKKRLLSIPRPLKTEKNGGNNNSYIIRKSVPKAFPTELVFESFDLYKRINSQKTESKYFRTQNRQTFYRGQFSKKGTK